MSSDFEQIRNSTDGINNPDERQSDRVAGKDINLEIPAMLNRSPIQEF